MNCKNVLLILFLIFGCSNGNLQYSVFEIETLNIMRDDFLKQAEVNGKKLDFIPQIKDWTRPSLASWREEQKAVAIPVWAELSETQISSLSILFGSTEKAKEVFPLLFRWFLIPHELTHAVQSSHKSQLNHWRSEQRANDVAAAFLNHTLEGKMRLKRLENLLAQVISILPQIETSGSDEETYFEKEYHSLTRDPQLYGNFQLRFIMKSLQNRDKLDLKQLFSIL